MRFYIILLPALFLAVQAVHHMEHNNEYVGQYDTDRRIIPNEPCTNGEDYNEYVSGPHMPHTCPPNTDFMDYGPGDYDNQLNQFNQGPDDDFGFA